MQDFYSQMEYFYTVVLNLNNTNIQKSHWTGMTYSTVCISILLNSCPYNLNSVLLIYWFLHVSDMYQSALIVNFICCFMPGTFCSQARYILCCLFITFLLLHLCFLKPLLALLELFTYLQLLFYTITLLLLQYSCFPSPLIPCPLSCFVIFSGGKGFSQWEPRAFSPVLSSVWLLLSLLTLPFSFQLSVSLSIWPWPE